MGCKCVETPAQWVILRVGYNCNSMGLFQVWAPYLSVKWFALTKIYIAGASLEDAPGITDGGVQTWKHRGSTRLLRDPNVGFASLHLTATGYLVSGARF